MTVFLTKEFFESANNGHDERVGGATTARPRRKSLSKLVLAAVQCVTEQDLVRVAALNAGIAFQPRSLLALITYCYAKGTCASQDIEDLMRRDAAFRLLCVNEVPGWRVLRRFRRKNRQPIHRCLAESLRQGHGAEEERIGSVMSLLAQGERGCPGEDRFEQEAAARIENAMLMDLMADDCDEW